MIRRGSFWSKIVALIVAGAPFLAAFGAFALWATNAWRDASRQLRAAEEAELRLAAEKVQAQAYEGLLARWREYASTRASGLWPVGEDSRLASEIAARASRAVEDAGGAVRDWSAAGVQSEGGLRRVRIDLVAEAAPDALYRILDGIETPAPFVMVERLVARAADAESPDLIEIQLRLSAVRLADPSG